MLKYINKLKFNDYMNFLHEAYKHDNNNLDTNYIGSWKKENKNKK